MALSVAVSWVFISGVSADWVLSSLDCAVSVFSTTSTRPRATASPAVSEAPPTSSAEARRSASS